MALNYNLSLSIPDDQWFHTSGSKSGICIHHTVGGSAASSIDWWKRDTQMVGTAFVVERNGTVYQAFKPEGWAYQFGLKWNQQDKIVFEKRFIGIEIASEGGLIESGGNLYCFNTVSPRTLKKKEEVFDYGKPYRGFRYFDKYDPVQIDSVVQLINKLVADFNIERKIPRNYINFYGEKLKDFKGIIGHVNVRDDKSDPIPDDTFWNRIIKECGLQLVDIGAPATSNTFSTSTSKSLTTEEIEKLFQENLTQFNKMNRSAGNMVKGLLWELQDGGRNTYIRLKDAVQDGHIVHYEIVQGDPALVSLAAQSLGFKNWDANKLEVFNA